MHGFVAQRLRGISRCIAGLLLPFFISTVRLLIDVHDLVFGICLVSPSHAKLGLIGGNSDFPAIQRHAVVDVVGDGVHLRRILDGIRIAIRTASRHQIRNALVDFNFVVLHTVLGGLSLIHIREIVAELGSANVRRLIPNRHQAVIGAIRRFVVIPKLLAGVLLILGIDFASVRHHTGIGIGIGFSKGIVRRSRARVCIAKALQQACAGEDRIVRQTRQAYLLKLCRDLIGTLVIAQATKQT